MTRSFAALRMTGRAELGRDAAGQSGQGLAPEDVSTPGLGQGEGPVGYKFFSKEEDASSLAGFRLRKGRRRRWEGPEWRAPRATGTEFLRSQLPAAPGGRNARVGIPGALEAFLPLVGEITRRLVGIWQSEGRRCGGLRTLARVVGGRAWSVYFGSGDAYRIDSGRYFGPSVRPVSE